MIKRRKILVEIDYEWSESIPMFLKYLKGWHRWTIHKIRFIKELKKGLI